MPYTSLRVLHPAVQSVPPRLRECHALMRHGMTKFLLSCLLEQPAMADVGCYRWRRGTVQLSGNSDDAFPGEVTYKKVDSAVASLRIWLRNHRFRLGVWRRCEAGTGCRGYRYTKEEVPFKIGLVNTRRRLKGGERNGSARPTPPGGAL